jgi:hypothetical protein
MDRSPRPAAQIFYKIPPRALRPLKGQAQRLFGLAQRIILVAMGALLSPVQEGEIWRVQIVWPNGAVHYFGKFTSKRDTTAWINAHSHLTKPATENAIDEPQIDLQFNRPGPLC